MVKIIKEETYYNSGKERFKPKIDTRIILKGKGEYVIHTSPDYLSEKFLGYSIRVLKLNSKEIIAPELIRVDVPFKKKAGKKFYEQILKEVLPKHFNAVNKLREGKIPNLEDICYKYKPDFSELCLNISKPLKKKSAKSIVYSLPTSIEGIYEVNILENRNRK